MNDGAVVASLAVRAKRLTALARAKRDDLDVSQAQGQVQTALNKLDQGLAELADALRVHRKLKEMGVPVTDPIGLEKAAKRLQEQVALGRPTAQFLGARSRELESVCSAIDQNDASAWQIWSGQLVHELPVVLLPRVALTRRSATAKRISDLRALSGKRPTIADIVLFQSLHRNVVDEFKDVEGSSIDSLLERFVAGRILMSELSDEDLEALRSDDSLCGQLYVQIIS